MKKIALTAILFLLFTISHAQSKGYHITVNLKNCQDTIAFLTFYQYDKTLIKDTCKVIKNGKIVFTGKKPLDKGIYSIVSQQKSIYFDFFVDENHQNLEISTETGQNLISSLNSNSSLQNTFFSYIKTINQEGTQFFKEKEALAPKNKKDSLVLFEKQRLYELKLLDIEEDFITKNKGTFPADVVNLKIQRVLKNPPKASNGRTDSIAVFNYYKKHYWDDVNWKDVGICKNPFFHIKLKKYFDHVVYPHPDSAIVAVDRIIKQTEPGSLLFKLLIGNLTYQFESSKQMGMDKVFVHMADTYFKTGKAVGIYNDDSVIDKIIKRAERLRPIMVGKIAPELSMIDIKNAPKVKAWGFEKATTSEEVTKLFYANYNELNKMFTKLHDVKAKYTILIFWDVDCGHCQKEIPVLRDVYNDLLKENKDVKVYSVYTLFDSEKYKKYIEDNKLNFINVYDGPHFNNVIEKYDVYSTPVIYILDKDKRIKAKRIAVEQIKNIIEILDKEAS